MLTVWRSVNLSRGGAALGVFVPARVYVCVCAFLRFWHKGKFIFEKLIFCF
jgi:hypothetical protein